MYYSKFVVQRDCRRTQTWRLHIKLYKFGWHTSAKNTWIKNSRDQILGEVVYKYINNLSYPRFLGYAILAWGSTYTSSLLKVQVKQNHVARLIFFANMRGKDTESALPLLNLLDMFTVYNIYSLHVLKFAHLWHKGLLPDVFRNTFEYASEVQSYNTRYATQKNLYKPQIGRASCRERV